MSGSNAESDVLVELQNRHLLQCLTSNFYMEINTQRGTFLIEIDFYWKPPYHYAVFLDGDKVHQSVFRCRRDNYVSDHLEDVLKMTVDRFPYSAPITVARKTEIVDAIEDTLKKIRGEKKVLFRKYGLL